MSGEQGIGLTWGDGLGWGQDEAFGFRRAELQGTIVHSYRVVKERAHSRMGLIGTDVGIEYVRADTLLELITEPDLGKTQHSLGETPC